MLPYDFSWREASRIVSVEDYHRSAMRRLPAFARAYIEGAAADEITYKENEAAFARLRFRQRTLTGVATPKLATTIMGVPVTMPVALAPTGSSGLSHWRGDIAAARAAERAGTRFALSSMGSYTLEEVAEATDQNHWYQLYPVGSREATGAMMERARAAGYGALIITVDVPTTGNREGERRSGVTLPPLITPRRILEVAAHPRWGIAALRHRRLAPVAFTGPSALTAEQIRFLTELSWDDLKWIRDRWQGRFYVKGILDTGDAARAVTEVGAHGVIVSNHGGRQLDRAPATIDALPAVVAEVRGRGEVYVDGGIRRGEDAIAALCLGAQGVFIGRPYLYGLAVGGEQGVIDILSIFQAELTRAMILMGCPSVTELDPSWLLGASSADESSRRPQPK